jgi:hypothetical protein
MGSDSIPPGCKGHISEAEWGKSRVGHKSTIIEYPEETKTLLDRHIFSFEEMIRFQWQELQAILINCSSVCALSESGFPSMKLHLYDAPQLIEILHNIRSFLSIQEQGVTAEELSKFSGYQLRLVLTHPESMAAILKNFEGVDELLRLKWNWIEEMLLRPEDALALLVYGVKWDQIDHLQAWDFGWFLKHRHEIMTLLDYGVDFDTIAHLDRERLALSSAIAPLEKAGVSQADLQKLDFWQLFMLLSHRSEFLLFLKEGVPLHDFLELESASLEQLLQNPKGTLAAFKSDSEFFGSMAGMRPYKIGILLEHADAYAELALKKVDLKDLKPLLDEQLRLVLENSDVFSAIIDLAIRYHLPNNGVLALDLNTADLMIQNKDKLEKLLSAGLTFDDLMRFPLIFSQILQFADRITELSGKGIPTQEIFQLSKDQIQFAFTRFPLLDILPELALRISDLQPFDFDEFKQAFSHLKALSILKKGGIDMKILSQIKMPHFGVILKYPEYVLSVNEKGVPLYKFDLTDAHSLAVMLQNPLTSEAQKIIQDLMQK